MDHCVHAIFVIVASEVEQYGPIKQTPRSRVPLAVLAFSYETCFKQDVLSAFDSGKKTARHLPLGFLICYAVSAGHHADRREVWLHLTG